MKNLLSSVLPLLVILGSGPIPASEISIVMSASADKLEKWAAAELSGFLGELYAKDTFPVIDSANGKPRFILLSSDPEHPLVRKHVPGGERDEEGEFVVRHIETDDQDVGIIAGNSPKAVRDGVYSLLEQGLGHGFYLHRNAAEGAGSGNFGFQDWKLQAKPVFGERVIFNWYNFLSGVSTWNLTDYQHWIRQAARMRHTDVMLHAYGWSPFTEFSHNGVTKPVEYLQNTAFGNHWGVVHTADVRRLVGGEVFAKEGPVFGADVGKVGHGGIIEENRVAKAKAMLRDAIDYTVNTVGLDFNWAIDIDTTYSNPRNLIATLPESARFRVGKHWLARPDTEEGYQFFRTMVGTMMSDFPAITKVTLWSRNSRGTGFGGLTTGMTPDDLPAAWRETHDNAPPEARTPYAAGHIYHAKVAAAFRKALDELGHDDVKLGFGSWWREEPEGEMASDNFLAANHFLPSEITFYPLDYYMAFGENASFRNQLAKIASERNLVLIEWAHHDDGGYLGRPYQPPAEFASKLREVDASGYGTIHWMTRPLDVFFKNLQNQAWSNTLNEGLETTCRKMALDFFGKSQSGVMTEYLSDWMNIAPQFGRETGPSLGGDSSTDRDKDVRDHNARAGGCDRRIAILNRVDASQLSTSALETWKFFRAQEEWIRLFHLAQKNDDPALKRATIRKYAEMISHDGGPTRGEMGILIQHNLKWLDVKTEDHKGTDAN